MLLWWNTVIKSGLRKKESILVHSYRGIRVPRVKAVAVGGHGSWHRKLRDHILNSRCEARSAHWRRSETTLSQILPLVTHFLQQGCASSNNDINWKPCGQNTSLWRTLAIETTTPVNSELTSLSRRIKCKTGGCCDPTYSPPQHLI